MPPTAVILLLWVLLFWQVSPSWSVLPQYNFGWLMPVLGAYLWWGRWQTRPEPAPCGAASIVILCLGFLLLCYGPLRLTQESNRDWQLVSWGLAAVAVMGSLTVVFLAGGWSWVRHFIFPALFPVLAVPWPSKIEQPVVLGLMEFVAMIASEGLTWAGIPAIQKGNIIITSNGPVGVDDACSGIQSFQASVMMSLFLGEVLNLGKALRIGIFFFSVSWAFFGNLVRSVFLSWQTHVGGAKALDGWHDPAGYIAMIFCYAGIISAALWMARGIAPPAAAKPGGSPRWLTVGPAFAVAAWLGIVEVGTEWWYRRNEAPSDSAASWGVDIEKKLPGVKMVEPTGGERTVLRFNTASFGKYHPPGEEKYWGINFLKWDKGNLAMYNARFHNPSICQVAGGMDLREEYPVRLFKVAGIEIPFRCFLFEKSQVRMFSFYGFWEAFGEKATQAEKVVTKHWTTAERLNLVRRGWRPKGLQVLNVSVVGHSQPEEAAREFQTILDRVGVRL